MTPNPSTPPRRPSNRRDGDATPIRTPTRQPTITDALVDVLLPRSITQPRPPRRKDELEPKSPTPARTRTRPLRKTIDLGKPLAPYDSNSVRDRVLKWQAQGAALVDQQDPPEQPSEVPPTIIDDDIESHAHESLRRVKGNRGSASVDSTKNADRSRKSQRHSPDERDASQRSVSKHSSDAPRKRVVSDGHWVKTSPTKAQHTSTKESSHDAREYETVDDGIRVEPMEATSTPKKRYSALRRSRSRESVETDVPTTPKGRSRLKQSPSNHLPREQQPKSRKSHTSVTAEEQPRLAQDPQSPAWRAKSTPTRTRTPREPPVMSGALEPEDAANFKGPSVPRSSPPEKSVKSSFTAESEERTRTRPSPRKVSMLREVYDEGKRIFGKSESQPPPQLSSSSIEAWLSGTADPFLDAQEPPSAPEHTPDVMDDIDTGSDVLTASHLTPADSGSRRGSRRHSRGKSPPSKVGEETSADQYHVSFAPRPGKSPKADHNDDGKTSEDNTSPSPLKRTGAKRGAEPKNRRRKSSSARHPVSEDPISESRLNSPAKDVPNDAMSSQPVPVPAPLFNRNFPPTEGHRLSTIASVETFHNGPENVKGRSRGGFSEGTATAVAADNQSFKQGRAAGSTVGPERAGSKKCDLKRRLTTHSDLISVLSLPNAGNKSIKSARSIRTNRSRLGTATVADLMQELSVDESKYMRELRTLVDGVIPVLLTCVLSKSDSAVAAGLFNCSNTAEGESNVTRPIVDMGIALERLKSLHRRIPQNDPDRLLRWAQGAQKVYGDYLRCWRMGFQDVVVNLAPKDGETKPAEGENASDDVLPRNAAGDVINGDGERVDVAFLLKRPLVRLKYLAKTFKGLQQARPTVAAEEQATGFQGLVNSARARANEERARLEDERAASIDASRARDPRTLAPATGISIDRSRRVKARDHFALGFQHSSGQRIDCRVELLLREDAPDRGGSGDLLICEIDETGRWLLLPPITSGRYSARVGDSKGQMVVMIRGIHSQGEEWTELLSLETEDEETAQDWIQLLGSTPIPPAIVRSQSFLERRQRPKMLTLSESPAGGSESAAGQVRTPSPTDIEVPFGEQGRASSLGEHAIQQPVQTPPARISGGDLPRGSESSIQKPTRLHKEPASSPASRPVSPLVGARVDGPSTPRSLNEAMSLAGSGSGSGLRRAKAKRLSKHNPDSPSSPASPTLSRYLSESPQSTSSRKGGPLQAEAECEGAKRLSLPNTFSESPRTHKSGADIRSESEGPARLDESSLRSLEADDNVRPRAQRRISSVPSLELPTIPKLRKSTPTSHGQNSNVVGSKSASSESEALPQVLDDKAQSAKEEDPKPPVPPPHRSPSPMQIKLSKTPKLGPTSTTAKSSHRRSSSPLKHEYAPSSAGSSSSSEASDAESENTPYSDSSEDEEEELEDGDAPTPLLPWGALRRFGKVSPKGSLYSLPNGTLTPSQSASQAPYKTVPRQPTQAARAIASIFSWSDAGFWKNLHPDECSIVITPGLIEAFEMSAAHSQPVSAGIADESAPSSPQGENKFERPLVGLELTPLVPLRRGTALDISIRSPPTARSTLSAGNNIMFRSRNPEECEALYAMINTSRINNPTYIALQNARGPYESDYGSAMDNRRRQSVRGRGSWWGWGTGRGKNSYRASSAALASSTAVTESSVGSFASSFSALKRFGVGGAGGSGGRLFNISKSTVTSRVGSRSNSIYSTSSSLSSSAHPSGGSQTPPSSSSSAAIRHMDPSIGLTNAKIRLYHRETPSKWRDMGSARLSISRPPPGFGSQRATSTGTERRVLVHGKTAGEVLLDVCLEESAFERVARTGIALSIWEEEAGPNGDQVEAVGGVGAKTKMKSEAETAYTFSLVGKLRY
ncbi:MAG: hypothetical protein M1825_004671 [Sarcosagium campestre]|nr:MAG: hypothetical protein M1825_004671 [Sarcosagium campestre]